MSHTMLAIGSRIFGWRYYMPLHLTDQLSHPLKQAVRACERQATTGAGDAKSEEGREIEDGKGAGWYRVQVQQG